MSQRIEILKTASATVNCDETSAIQVEFVLTIF